MSSASRSYPQPKAAGARDDEGHGDAPGAREHIGSAHLGGVPVNGRLIPVTGDSTVGELQELCATEFGVPVAHQQVMELQWLMEPQQQRRL